MKKNDILLAVAVALYSFLFYNQLPGINFLLFTVALILFQLALDKKLANRASWLLAAGGSLMSALCVMWYGNTLSLVSNLVSLSLLSAFSVKEGSSLLFALVHSFYSYASSLLFMFINRLERSRAEEEKEGGRWTKKLALVLIPFLITLLFFFMYRGSNALFNELAKKINFDFLSWNWIAFTLGGFVLLYGFFRHRQLSFIATYDAAATNTLNPQANRTVTLFGKKLSLSDENFSGVILLLMLNTLLLVVNALDVNYLFVDGKLPAGLSYSAFVHQGVGLLITSIIVAVAIILFYFRGALNFYEKSPFLKFLAYLWIVQNIFMLFSTAVRNDLYITEYGLTYKRIGVYVYLLLTMIGLCTTMLKIARARSNMYLVRINSWLFYTVLLISCVFNWDLIITGYNIHKARHLERAYLVSLSYSNLPQLYQLRNDTAHKYKEFHLHANEYGARNDSYDMYYNYNDALNNKLFFFLQQKEMSSWQSWTYRSYEVAKELDATNVYKNIHSLSLRYTGLRSLEGIQHFKALRKLHLDNNYLTSLEPLRALPDLEELSLRDNQLEDLSPLYGLKKLKKLSIDTTNPDVLKTIQKHLPNTIIN